MRYEVEGSGLDPEDLEAVGKFERADAPAGERGIGTDLLVAISGNVASGGISAVLTGIWLAWRRRRERVLRDASASTVRVEVGFANGREAQVVLELRGDGADGIRRLVLETGAEPADEEIQGIKVTFPVGR